MIPCALTQVDSDTVGIGAPTHPAPCWFQFATDEYSLKPGWGNAGPAGMVLPAGPNQPPKGQGALEIEPIAVTFTTSPGQMLFGGSAEFGNEDAGWLP